MDKALAEVEESSVPKAAAIPVSLPSSVSPVDDKAAAALGAKIAASFASPADFVIPDVTKAASAKTARVEVRVLIGLEHCNMLVSDGWLTACRLWQNVGQQREGYDEAPR